jgi:hypothetical protein
LIDVGIPSDRNIVQIDVAVPSDRNIVQMEAEKKLKYKNLSTEIHHVKWVLCHHSIRWLAWK